MTLANGYTQKIIIGVVTALLVCSLTGIFLMSQHVSVQAQQIVTLSGDLQEHIIRERILEQTLITIQVDIATIKQTLLQFTVWMEKKGGGE